LDIFLSRKGIEEALECASKLENIELDLAFASNLVRTQEIVFLNGKLQGKKKKDGRKIRRRKSFILEVGL